MANNMDGVKISVKNESEEEAPAKKANNKKQVQKKKAKPEKPAQAAKKKEEKTPAPKEAKKTNSSGPQKKNIISFLIPIIVTAAVVGGGVYAWQKKATDSDIQDVRNDARESRISFEKRLADLKDKLTGVETENVELKTTQENMAEATRLLNEAKLEFFDEDLGIRFDYPAVFGKVNIEYQEGTIGMSFIGMFSANDKLIFGGVSKDYLPTASTSAFALTDTQGFADKKNKYYFLPLGNEDSSDYEIKPAKVIGFRGGEALLVDNKSFAAKETMPNIDIGQNVGLIVNLPGEDFGGLAFVNSDFGVLPIYGFETLAQSIETEK